MNDIQINIEAARQRDLINDMWKKSLNERKIAYYNALRCDKNAEIYIKWQTMENPILPEKFLIREIKGEHCEETEIRGQLALQRLATEISLLQTRKHRFEEKFLSIDATVLAEISEKCKGNIEAKLHEMWTQDTKCEEEKSKAVWQKHQEHFDNYEKNYGDESIMKLKPQRPARTKGNNDIHMNNVNINTTPNQPNVSQNTNTGTYAAVASKSTQKKIDNTALRNKSSKRPNTQSRNPSPENFQQNNDEWKVVNNRGRGRGGRRGRGRGRTENSNRGGRGGNSRGRGRGARQPFLERGQNLQPPDPISTANQHPNRR
ncbi:unnamed protein product [Mytilus edulis]|uniref:Uncharacterized protein n=1 Tax=Mytilus edulis TaxID=6550 RepID=A0A8S3V3T6_MYTED|nr:unnamed protein product [Mytilus edulis]